MDLIADDDDNIKVSGFAETPDGNPGPAEKSGEIKEGDYLLGCNETSFEDLGFYDSIDVIKAAGYPKEFLFEHPPVEPKPDLEGWFGKKGEKTIHSADAISSYMGLQSFIINPLWWT